MALSTTILSGIEQRKLVNFGPLTSEIKHPLEVDGACSAYANALEFGLHDFASGGISTF